jgi:hypothetical protein
LGPALREATHDVIVEPRDARKEIRFIAAGVLCALRGMSVGKWC